MEDAGIRCRRLFFDNVFFAISRMAPRDNVLLVLQSRRSRLCETCHSAKRSTNCPPDTQVTRIEFRRVD
jgi:hypothetical protein